MNGRNRVGLYGAYFLGIMGIGFTLPYLPLYLGQEGLSDLSIGLISTLAALASLAQYPIGLWSDRVGRRTPFLIAALTVLAVATWLVDGARGTVWLALLVILFAENGICRATVESLTGAIAARLAPQGQVGAALGALRFWKPVGIVLAALLSGIVAERYGVGAALVPLAVVQGLAVVAAALIREPTSAPAKEVDASRPTAVVSAHRTDGTLWLFVAAMVLFHVANAPGGVYLGLFMKRDLGLSERILSYAFVVSMAAWMLIIRPAGKWADRVGRRPLLVVGWSMMSARLFLLAFAAEAWQVLAIQVLDGLAQSMFAVAAAAWVTDRLADVRRAGEAQALVGTSLVFGSAIGPALAGLVVEDLGYRGTFLLLGIVGAAATGLVLIGVPESMATRAGPRDEALVAGKPQPLAD